MKIQSSCFDTNTHTHTSEREREREREKGEMIISFNVNYYTQCCTEKYKKYWF